MSELDLFDTGSSEKGLIRAGAIAFLAAGTLTVILAIVQFLSLFVFVNKEATITYGISANLQMELRYALITPVQVPSTPATSMTFIANHLTYYRIGYPSSGVIALILLIGIPALYVSLRKIRPTPITLASLLALIFLVVRAQGWATLFSLINTSQSYVQSTSDFQRAAYLAVFQSTVGIASADLLVSIIALHLAFLTIAVVMLKSQTLKWAGVFGTVSALFGLTGALINVETAEISEILQTIWFFILAFSLWQFSGDPRYKLPGS